MATDSPLTAERLEEVYTAFNEGDFDTVVNAMAEDIEWVEPAGELHAGTYHGPEEVMENVFAPTSDDFDSFGLDIHRIIEDGDMLVAEGVYEVTSNAGTDYEIPFVHVWRTQDGLLTEQRNYTDTVLMREAAGT